MRTNFVTAAQFPEPLLPECASVYMACFNGEPWNEAWTIASALERFSEAEKQGADFICACEAETGKVIGIAIGVPNGAPCFNEDSRAFLEERNVPANAYYIADVAVVQSARGQHVGLELTKCLVSCAFKRQREIGRRGYEAQAEGCLYGAQLPLLPNLIQGDGIISRTLPTNDAMLAIFHNLKFRDIGVRPEETGGKVSDRVYLHHPTLLDW
ncbi:hypothetical protein JNK13_00925 [bacterium]|nr:hypothetical protein [bacterium]